MGIAIVSGVAPAFIAGEKMQYNALVNILGNVFPPLLVLPTLILARRLEAIMGAATVASFLGGAVAYFLLTRVIGPPILKWNPREWTLLLGQSFPLFVGGMLSAVFDRADVLVLRSARGAVAVGQYRAVYHVLNIMAVVVISAVAALAPTIYRSFRDDRPLHSQVFHYLSRWAWASFLWLALCISLAARPLTGLLYGKEFLAAAPATAVLAWCLPLTALTYSIGEFFLAAGKQIYSIHVWGAAVLTNVACNLALTYRFGMMGAAASMVISCAVFCGTQLFLADSRLGLRLEWDKVLLLLVSCGAAALVSYGLIGMNLSLALLSATAIYFGLAFATRGLGRQEVRLLRQFVTRR